jgi:CRISPR-associated protein Cas6/Cse3/CasE subtype I-E
MFKFVTSHLQLNKEDGHLRHQEIQRHFPYGKEVRFRDDGDKVTVYCAKYPVTDIDCQMTTLPQYKYGDELKFRILTCPTTKNEKRIIPVRGIKNLVAWFQNQAKKHGFSVVTWEKVIPMGVVHAVKGEQKRTHNAAEFQGKLKVLDRDVFNSALGSLGAECFGIGRAKYCGFGLLDIME